MLPFRFFVSFHTACRTSRFVAVAVAARAATTPSTGLVLCVLVFETGRSRLWKGCWLLSAAVRSRLLSGCLLFSFGAVSL